MKYLLGINTVIADYHCAFSFAVVKRSMRQNGIDSAGNVPACVAPPPEGFLVVRRILGKKNE